MTEIKVYFLKFGLPIKYKGDTHRGKPHGWGKGFYRDNRMYEGEWKYVTC